MARPPVSVIVPFGGDAADAARLSNSLALLELEDGDEIVVADNSTEGCYPEGTGARVVRATRERSSYYARNAGAGAATGETEALGASEWHLSNAGRDSDATGTQGPPSTREGRKMRIGRGKPCPREELGRWLVFIDSDCVPSSDLLEAYFASPPADDVGALAGTVASDAAQRHFLARYASDRGFLDQEAGLHTAEDAAATANLAIRQGAFDEVGGFTEGIRSGGDVDFCRRLVAAGWRIERRADAGVRHLHRESLPDLLGSIARYAAGARWLNERYPGSAPAWPLVPSLIHCSKDAAGYVVRGRFEQAAFRGVDALGMFAHAVGYRRSNEP